MGQIQVAHAIYPTHLRVRIRTGAGKNQFYHFHNLSTYYILALSMTSIDNSARRFVTAVTRATAALMTFHLRVSTTAAAFSHALLLAWPATVTLTLLSPPFSHWPCRQCDYFMLSCYLYGSGTKRYCTRKPDDDRVYLLRGRYLTPRKCGCRHAGGSQYRHATTFRRCHITLFELQADRRHARH